MRPVSLLVCWFVVGPLAAGIAAAQGPAERQRDLLDSIPENPTGRFRDAVAQVRNPSASARVGYDKLSPRTDYYVRIAPRGVVVDGQNRLKPGATLGRRPFVFVTSPQGVAGKSLLAIYQDIGYEAADILTAQRDKDMVAVVFRFPAAVRECDARDGRLPDDWDRRVYVPTWDNLHALFARLAEAAVVEPVPGGVSPTNKLVLGSEAEREFVTGYPSTRLKRLKKDGFLTYQTLMRAGGTDWEYRKLLEDKLSVSAHFRGTGRTVNVCLDPYMRQPDTGIFEYLGPNTALNDLPEVAVVHLGSLKVEEMHPGPAPRNL